MREPACLQIPLLAVKTGQPRDEMLWQKKSPLVEGFFLFGGPDETRTRDPMRDRHVF